jgi:DNA-binding MarR family transcriptional regulator
MLTEENLMDARYHIILLQEKQEKIFQELLDEIKDKHKEMFPDLEHELVDF